MPILYYGIGKYISLNSRNVFWGKGAIDTISDQLTRELPGLKGFSPRNLRSMRVFYEEWSVLDTIANDDTNLAEASAKIIEKSSDQICNKRLSYLKTIRVEEFFEISFSSHLLIISKVKNTDVLNSGNRYKSGTIIFTFYSVSKRI